jgi:hypothetical protein
MVRPHQGGNIFVFLSVGFTHGYPRFAPSGQRTPQRQRDGAVDSKMVT